MKPLLLGMVGIGGLGLVVSGCGHTAPLAATAPSSSTVPAAAGSPSVSPSGTSALSPSSTPSPFPSTPPPPNAGIVTELTVQVQRAVWEGTLQLNGRTREVYLLQVALRNPTSGLVPIHLNTLTVETAGSSASSYSANDVVAQGLSPGNSLFPWPVDASHPATDTRYVEPGQTVVGDMTVAVPSSAQGYQIVWSGSAIVVATFSP